MTARLIDFSPSAWEAYQEARITEHGPVIRQALEQIASTSASDLAPVRYQVVEERLSRTPEVWGLPIDGPDGTHWLIVWREMPYVVEIGHIGTVPPGVPSSREPVPDRASRGYDSVGSYHAADGCRAADGHHTANGRHAADGYDAA